METIRDVFRKYSDRRIAARNKIDSECRFEVKEKLKELGLDGLVRRKEDGKIGKLVVSSECYDLEFYPLKKNGLESSVRSGCVWKPEEEFEPYKE